MEELARRVEILEEKVKKLESFLLVNKPEIGKKDLSIKEFIISKNPVDEIQKTLAIGYFLENHEGFKTFNTKDLAVSFEKAKEKKPLNINDQVNKNIRNGHMAESKDKKDGLKAWYITGTGETFVKNNFEESK